MKLTISNRLPAPEPFLRATRAKTCSCCGRAFTPREF